MSPEERIAGALAAAVTPLREGGERVDEEAFGPLLDFYAASGLDGLLVLGTTGEGILLDEAERRRVAELWVTGAERLRVIVHCGAQSTRDTCALAAHAAETGAAGVAVIGPPYFRYSEEELVDHFLAAARACSPLPFYIYEYADRSGYAVPVTVVQQVRERTPNLLGMKVSDAPFERVEPYLGIGLDVFVGAEALITRALEAGAVGAVSGLAAGFPEAVVDLVREPSVERSDEVSALRAALSKHGFQASIKAALGLRGIPVKRDVRAPLRALTPDAVQELRAELGLAEARL